jgi:cytochrome c oxidase assembly protein subunit 11
MVPARQPASHQNRRVAFMAMLLAASMLGLAFASVPLYRLFCQVTGFGGTTQVAEQLPTEASGPTLTIRFDANIDSALAWNFHPKDQQQMIRVGEVGMAHYVARSTASGNTTGSAVFNVTPPEAGIYFNKISCFCFSEQTLKPGEVVEMPVQYFVDPAILENADTRGIREITLSYTFYRVAEPATEKQADATN